jgi:hypothetical protein
MNPRLVAAAATLIASLAAPAVVHAREMHVHAFACTTFGGKPIDLGFALQNDSATETMAVICAIPDSSSFPKASIKTLNLHGFDNGADMPGEVIDGVRAHLCTSVWHTTGGGCTSFEPAGGLPGDYTLQLLPVSISSPHRGWTSTTISDFGYVRVLLPRKDANGRATFRGYFISDQPPF